MLNRGAPRRTTDITFTCLNCPQLSWGEALFDVKSMSEDGTLIEEPLSAAQLLLCAGQVQCTEGVLLACVGQRSDTPRPCASACVNDVSDDGKIEHLSTDNSTDDDDDVDEDEDEPDSDYGEGESNNDHSVSQAKVKSRVAPKPKLSRFKRVSLISLQHIFQ